MKVTFSCGTIALIKFEGKAILGLVELCTRKDVPEYPILMRH